MKSELPKKDLCIDCRKMVSYHTVKVPYKKETIYGAVKFDATEYVCDECGGEVCPNGSIDQFVSEYTEALEKLKECSK